MQESHLKSLLTKLTSESEDVVDLSGLVIESSQLSAIFAVIDQREGLTKMVFNHCQLDDASIALIADFLEQKPAIVTVHLNFNNMTDDGASHIARILRDNASLEELFIAGNHLSHDGIVGIAQSLAQNQTLKTLNIGWNLDRNPESIALIFAEENIAQNTTIESIKLGLGPGRKEMEPITKGLKEVAEVTSRNIALCYLNPEKQEKRPQTSPQVRRDEKEKVAQQHYL